MAQVQSRRGLGRGLSALLEEGTPVNGVQTTDLATHEIAIELIRRNPEQPRRTFDEADLQELTDSIRDRGVLQPILVRPAPDAPSEFQIVAGERRWRAAQRVGLHAIPALVRSLDDAAVAEISLVENVQRANLNPLEEALGYKSLVDRFGHTQESIAHAVGKSRSHVANTLRLVALPERVRDYLRSGQLSAGHARAIAAAPNPAELADRIVNSDLTVRQAEALARRTQQTAQTATSPKARNPIVDADTASLESDLQEILGMTVKIVDKHGNGEMKIKYASLDQLDILCRKLSGS